jgi:hypothetical protein
VRYEDLSSDPVGTLVSVTSRIRPVPPSDIDRAVLACDFERLHRDDPKFFRSGRVGDWRSALPPSIVAAFADVDFYRSQFDILGYSLDDDAAIRSLAGQARPAVNPFRQGGTFDNGVSIPRMVTQLYVSREDAGARWPAPQDTGGDGSLFAWLTGPADDDPCPGRLPCISNLAFYIYTVRADLGRAFPDVFGADRQAFAGWFATSGAREHQLPEGLVAASPCAPPGPPPAARPSEPRPARSTWVDRVRRALPARAPRERDGRERQARR